jgi:hypothetical protein
VPLFDVYGRFRIRVTRSGDRWAVHELGSEGKQRVRYDVLIPDDAAESEIPGFLEAAFHEAARPGDCITRLE